MKRYYLLRVLLPVAILVLGSIAGFVIVSGRASIMKEPNQATVVSRAELQAFQAAGDVGGGVLEPGTMFPPTKGSQAVLERGEDWVSYTLHTTGLPPGAYTNWWVFFNNPDGCVDACDMDDLLSPEPNVSVLWSAGDVVQSNGVGNFRARISEGQVPSEAGQLILGQGLADARRAEVHIIVKYHGPASDNPDVLHEQIHTLLGSCQEGANALDLGEPFGVQCFDPQSVAFPGISDE